MTIQSLDLKIPLIREKANLLEQQKIGIPTPNCAYCGSSGHVDMTKDEYDTGREKLAQGSSFSEAFPFLSPDLLEMLISGTHSWCKHTHIS
jgi:hypothetical protein